LVPLRAVLEDTVYRGHDGIRQLARAERRLSPPVGLNVIASRAARVDPLAGSKRAV
jgi:hypothetical protein